MLRTGIAVLDRSANRLDRSGFVRTVEAMDWDTLSIEVLNAAMENAVTLEALRLARQIAEYGQKRFPDDPRFPELARLIAPTRVLGTSPASGKEQAASWAWLRENQHRYPGKWIAVKDGVLLGAEDDLALLRPRMEAAGKKGVLLVHVLSSSPSSTRASAGRIRTSWG